MTTDAEILESTSIPPQTTRAKARGDFVKAAQSARRDYTVDWVHLKASDQAQRTVLCKDPFANVDERVGRLIEGDVRRSVTTPRARRRVCSGVVVAALAVLLVACTSPDEPDRTVTVSGSFGGVPPLEFAKPLTVTEPYIEVVWEGDGPEASRGRRSC